MKRLFAGMVLSATILLLSGCYIDPGYGYVRQNSYQGAAYYGQPASGYGGGYYAAPVYGSYYGGGYGYGCCYAPGVSVGISSAWYGRERYYGNRYPGYRHYGNGRGYSGQWRGSSRANTVPRHVERRDGERPAYRGRPRDH